MLTGVTGMTRLCHVKGRSRGTSDSTTEPSVPMWGQNTTSCFSNRAALTKVMMFSTDRDLNADSRAACITALRACRM